MNLNVILVKELKFTFKVSWASEVEQLWKGLTPALMNENHNAKTEVKARAE